LAELDCAPNPQSRTQTTPAVSASASPIRRRARCSVTARRTGNAHSRVSAAAPEGRGPSGSCCYLSARHWTTLLVAAAPLAVARRSPQRRAARKLQTWPLNGSHMATTREKAHRVPEGAPGRWWRGCGGTHASTYVAPSSTLASGLDV
jgi:hypothetical protein